MAGHAKHVFNQLLHLKTMEGNRLEELSDAELTHFFMFDYKVRSCKFLHFEPVSILFICATWSYSRDQISPTVPGYDMYIFSLRLGSSGSVRTRAARRLSWISKVASVLKVPDRAAIGKVWMRPRVPACLVKPPNRPRGTLLVLPRPC